MTTQGAALPAADMLPPPPAPAAVRSFLPEVQALRAVAVSLVLAYHYWPALLAGGYVGVDVFFVISGFLITSHLHRELERRGKISLGAFYARRARRLLPAALLVLAASVGASLAFLPETRWANTAHEVLASTFYVENWYLAGRAVQYSASNDAASAVQHYWSLSVEEQFYLVWPALLILLAFLYRRLRRGARSGWLISGIGAASLLSLAYSVQATSTDRAAAYFVTPTRIWELGTGALLALWSARPRERRAPRRTSAGSLVALRWAGVILVFASAVLLSPSSPFPGYLALAPVFGAVMVIAAGDAGRRDPLAWAFRLPPVQFLGAVSYALYLWHWPLLVVAPFVVGHSLSATEKIVLLVAALGLAWLTKVLVEDPVRRWRPMARRPWLTALSAAVAMTVVAAVAGLQLVRVDQLASAARARLAGAQHESCFGAAALAPGATQHCRDPFGPPVSPTLTTDDEYWFPDPACGPVAAPVQLERCRHGTQNPTRRIALIGDSHAQQWRGALHQLAREHGWEIDEMFKGGCPAADATVLEFNAGPIDSAACSAWNAKVADVVATERYDAVFTSNFAAAYVVAAANGRSPAEEESRGFRSTWSQWAASRSQVVVIRDMPATGDRNVPECLAADPRNPIACSTPRRTAVVDDPAVVAARGAGPSVHLVDLTRYFCDPRTCYAVIGGSQVYFDWDHLTSQYSRSLAPYLFESVRGYLR